MPIDSIQSGYNLINQSSQMASKAADDINSVKEQNTTLSVQQQNNLNPIEQQQAQKQIQKSSSDYIEPLIQLNQAVQYSKAGTNIVQKNQEMIGSLLDVRF